MIYSVAKHIAAGLFRNKSDYNDEEETIAYGLFVLLSNILYFTICLIVSIILDCITEGIIFYFSFQFAKKYSGGYHAKTELHCFVISTISVILSIILICLSGTNQLIVYIIFSFAVLFSISISIFAPLENPKKPLTEKDKRLYHHKAMLRTLLLLIAIIILYLSSHYCYAVAVSVGLLLAGILQLTGVLIN